MILIFFTIIFIIEIFVVVKLVSAIVKFDKKVVLINKQIEDVSPKLLNDLKNMHAISLDTCKKTHECSVFNPLLCIKPLVVDVLIGIIPLLLGAKWGKVFSGARTVLNFKNMSKLGIVFSVLKLVKKYVRISKK